MEGVTFYKVTDVFNTIVGIFHYESDALACAGNVFNSKVSEFNPSVDFAREYFMA